MDNRRQDNYEVIIFYNDFTSRVVATYKYRRNAVMYAQRVCEGGDNGGDAVGYKVRKYREANSYAGRSEEEN